MGMMIMKFTKINYMERGSNNSYIQNKYKENVRFSEYPIPEGIFFLPVRSPDQLWRPPNPRKKSVVDLSPSAPTHNFYV
jgi:hypothetical protein